MEIVDRLKPQAGVVPQHDRSDVRRIHDRDSENEKGERGEEKGKEGRKGRGGRSGARSNLEMIEVAVDTHCEEGSRRPADGVAAGKEIANIPDPRGHETCRKSSKNRVTKRHSGLALRDPPPQTVPLCSELGAGRCRRAITSASSGAAAVRIPEGRRDRAALRH